ncbi:cytochrome P450 [Hymenobacter psychrotolerans]|uniref:Cytochrome P450 n=1 Tax=Hymenobacter psychrotolerans DSM 18569 TaxID=1121959 RepID=A0A1M6VWA8_9BACT|nr:cytochrome P450 [Hymenobacter psychrotolerans]SHK85731.1 Cytochrome P450 [Hymenobacter psychrotolerans DSM 18569]
MSASALPPVASGLSTLPRVPRWRTLLGSLAMAREPIRNLDRALTHHGDTVGLHLGGVRPCIVTRDPALAQHILQKNHRRYLKSDLTHGLIRYLGRGLLTNEGADWLRQRRLIQPGFHRQRLTALTRLMQAAAEEWSAELRARLRAEPGGTLTVDIHSEMTRVAFHIIAQATFGTSMTDAERNRLSDILTRIQAFYVRTIRQPYLRPWFMASGAFRQHDALSHELRELVRGYIRRRQAAVSAGPPPDDLLQMLLDARYEDTEEGMSEEQLLDEANILLLAGHETSANALSWLFYLLARHPEAVRQVRQERAGAGLARRAPEFAELPRLPYSQQVVQETMRLYPPAWILDRVALEDDEFRGLPIPKGTLFSIYIYGIHRHPGLWPDPDAFRPERFAPGQEPPIPAYAYLPFGGGPRLCVGNHFALTEIQLVLLEALRHFNFQPAGPEAPGTDPLVTLRPKGPLWLQVTEATTVA